METGFTWDPAKAERNKRVHGISFEMARELEARGVSVRHILEDGAAETHADTMERLREKLKLPDCDLFRTAEDVIEDAYRMQGERIAYEVEEEAGPPGSALP